MSAMMFDCPACGGEAWSTAGEGTSLIHFACRDCGRESAALAYPAWVESGPRPAAYRAIVDVPAQPQQASKLRLRLARAFAKLPGFCLADLERQAVAGLSVWDLGRYYAASDYSDGTQAQAEQAAAQAGATLRFVLEK
ncbi:hypothetical protein [Lysobacter enzymogenes]|uniref:Uncharacterized protein n=1 Tax=Lysobacter enzymogenes TaxID=69 RepID=A0AAU9AE25_LYSEN|nr:hypothetical protein [Lysobacter enzymogenes]BAV96467.1 hypothetical protein LEN_0980 [Lysobacter enzymogenes]